MSRALLALAIVFFSFLQFKLFFAHQEPSPFRDADGINYLQSAESGQTNNFHGPGYPTAIRLVASLGMDTYSAAKLISRVSGAFLLVAAWFVFKRIAGERVASLASLALAVSPFFMNIGHSIMSDMFAGAMFWLALALAVAPTKQRLWMSAALGLAIGIAYMTRYAYFVSLFIPLFLLVEGEGTWSQRWKHALVTLAGFVLIAGLRLFEVATTSTQLFGDNYGNVAFRVLGDSVNMFNYTDHYSKHYEVNSLLDVIRIAPAGFFSNWRQSFAKAPSLLAEYFPLPRFEGISLFGALMLIGAIASVPLVYRKGEVRRVLLVVASLAVYATVVATAWFDHRILLPVVPVVAALLAGGIATLVLGVTYWAKYSKKLQFVLWPLTLPLAGLVLWGMKPDAEQMFRSLEESRQEYEVASEWLRQNGVGPGVPVVCNEPLVGARAGANLSLDLKNFSGRGDALATAVQGGGFLVLDHQGPRSNLKQFFRWLGATPPKNMREVFRTAGTSGELVIYRVDPA